MVQNVPKEVCGVWFAISAIGLLEGVGKWLVVCEVCGADVLCDCELGFMGLPFFIPSIKKDKREGKRKKTQRPITGPLTGWLPAQAQHPAVP